MRLFMELAANTVDQRVMDMERRILGYRDLVVLYDR